MHDNCFLKVKTGQALASSINIHMGVVLLICSKVVRILAIIDITIMLQKYL